MARPKITIDWKQVDKLLAIFCEGTEIASYLGMHPNTFYDRVQEEFKMSFTDYKRQKGELGNIVLRKAQFEAATEGNTSMMIFLGKQKLGQSDKIETINKNENKIDLSSYSEEEKKLLFELSLKSKNG
ncbi:hypothetical protein [Polaribacter sp. IC073]|uniref:hypothetical protein n=1 Tax=Polaribacter sp. IC073 TaxID=2508540 RepID=UPI0011BF39F8|nr:hypothetical protein [Polaribacter sp. IC073]TXD47358.1 hypothetical protein ES045_12230 [Polaribacter sp. IC073]